MIATYITSSGELVKIFFVAGISISFSPSTSLNSSPSSLSSSSLTSLIFQVDSFQFFSHECLFLVFVLAALSLPSHLFQTLLRVTFESSYRRFLLVFAVRQDGRTLLPDRFLSSPTMDFQLYLINQK